MRQTKMNGKIEGGKKSVRWCEAGMPHGVTKFLICETLM